MQAKLKIELLSNTCIALGSSIGETTDMDVYVDKNGKPYIPSKRIKGLIRSVIEEYNSLSNNSIDIERIIGKASLQGEHFIKGQGGSLYIEDAILDESMGTISVKTQTAIDETTHSAKEGSLRSISVIDKGTTFASNVTLEDKDFDTIKKVLPLLRHMGLNRNRGLGLVKVTIEKNDDSKTKLNFNVTSNLVKIKIENISNLMISSIDQNETIPYIPSSTILGYFANRYIKETNDEEKLKELFLNDGHLIFSNAYISDKNFNEYMPCPAFIKKYKNLNNEGRVEYINKFFKEENTSNKVERKIASLDDKYVRSDIFNNGLDINNIKVIEPCYEYAYHHSLKPNGEVKDFFQFLSLEKGQHFVGYVYGDINKLRSLFSIVNDKIAYFGKSRNSQYGKCNITLECIKGISNKGNILIFKAPVALTDNNKELLDANEIADKIKSGCKVNNYSLKYTNLGGFNMLWGLPKVAKTAIDGGSYIEFENISCDEIIAFLNKNNVSSLDYMIVDKNSVISNNKPYIPNNEEKVIDNRKEDQVLEKALKKYEENKGKKYINQTQLERLLMLLEQTKSYKEFSNQIDLVSLDKTKEKLKKIISDIDNEFNHNNDEEFKKYVKTYLTLLKWEGRKHESK